jgi:hypothetical protein
MEVESASFYMTKVSSLKELLPVLEPIAQSGKPLLILLKMLMVKHYLHW